MFNNVEFLNAVRIEDSALRYFFEEIAEMLLAKKQYHLLKNTLEKVGVEDFSSFYYATLYYLKDEYPIEYLKMPPELKETVEELVAEIEQMAIDYA
jgi:hypothetical protein